MELQGKTGHFLYLFLFIENKGDSLLKRVGMSLKRGLKWPLGVNNPVFFASTSSVQGKQKSPGMSTGQDRLRVVLGSSSRAPAAQEPE